jgi:transcriptional regulator with XRE-family HTH domain
MNARTPTPKWAAEVIKQLKLKGINQKDLAKELGLSAQYISNILCGNVNAPKIKQRIIDYLAKEVKNETKRDVKSAV